MTNEYRHIPVLLHESVEMLNLKDDSIVVDATLGGAGHSLAIAMQISSSGILIGIDQDEAAHKAASKRLNTLPKENAPRIELLHGNFAQLDELLVEAKIPQIDAILFDLGVSSPQLDWQSRGFSFQGDGPLDMRMNPGKQTLNATEVINTYNAADLTRIIRLYSDEKWASRIADFIVKQRETEPITTTSQLVNVIKAAIPAGARRTGGHPAKRTFQAIRIEVNSELIALKKGLEAAIRWLSPGGRMVVISYHSLEDKIVKEVMGNAAHRCTCPPDFPLCVCGLEPILKVITRKPLLPSKEEIERNPRSRSAKMRVAQKL